MLKDRGFEEQRRVHNGAFPASDDYAATLNPQAYGMSTALYSKNAFHITFSVSMCAPHFSQMFHYLVMRNNIIAKR
jgi:hypothetical protein